MVILQRAFEAAEMTTDLIKLDSARELVQAGAVQRTEVVGLPGGWSVRLLISDRLRTLATRTSQPRMFSTFEAALKVIHSALGLRGQVMVDPERWTPLGEHSRRRPDRALAMQVKEADARYAAFLRTALTEAHDDPRPALTAEHAQAALARHRKTRQDALDAALARGA